MEKRFTITDLQAACGKSRQALYVLMKQNSEFASLLDEHSSIEGHKRFFDSTILDWVKQYYQNRPAVASAVAPTSPEGQFGVNPNYTPLPEVEALKERVAALEAQLASKEAQLNDLIQQAAEAQKQTSQLLLLLQEEKQEKIKLLPPPKISWIKRIRSIFQRENHNS